MTDSTHRESLTQRRRLRWNGLWRRGAGISGDPDNGRLILRVTGINMVMYARKFKTRRAQVRALYWMLIRRYETELCQQCGRPVRVVFHTPDHIWEAATGRARQPSGEAASGILCPPCVDDLAEPKLGTYLRWTCSTSDEAMRS